MTRDLVMCISKLYTFGSIELTPLKKEMAKNVSLAHFMPPA